MTRTSMIARAAVCASCALMAFGALSVAGTSDLDRVVQAQPSHTGAMSESRGRGGRSIGDERAGVDQPFGSYEEALAHYNRLAESPPLELRAQSALRLAMSGDPRGLDVLIARYHSPNRTDERDPPHHSRDYKGRPPGPEHMRHLIVDFVTRYYNTPQHVAKLNAWTDRHLSGRDPHIHAWLAYRTLRADIQHNGPDRAREIIFGRRTNPYIRSAAIEALAIEEHPELFKIMNEILAEEHGLRLPTRPQQVDFILLYESLASGIMHLAPLRANHDHAFRNAVLGVIRVFDNGSIRNVTQRTKVTVGRHLAKAFGIDEVYLEAAPWRRMLDRGVNDDDGGRYARPQPNFMGIRGSGERIVYVIDFSDSMLEPLKGDEKEQLKGPITGGRRNPDGTRERNPEPGEEKEEPKDPSGLDPGELDWSKINNRFEAAREFLKLSLKSLDDKVHFAVCFFGDNTEFLESTPALVPANARNIQRAIADLDRFKADPRPQPNRPYGVLLGSTNFHGGFRRAFKVTDNARSPIGQYEHVQDAGFLSGADTIFLLSDGAPATDDWLMDAPREPEYRTGDSERGGFTNSDAPTLVYHGPYYARRMTMVNDIRRMNLFRKCEIHVIAIGEADANLCHVIADLGLGETRFVGNVR